MDHPLIALIDQQIAKAEAEGQFDGLSGAGKPLDLSGNAADALLDRMAKEAGGASPLAVLRDQIAEARARVAALGEGPEKLEAQRDLAALETKRAPEIETIKRFG